MARLSAILLVGLTLIVVGCGEGVDESSTSTTSTTGTSGASGASGAAGPQSDFAKQADEICREGGQEDDALAKEIFSDLGPNEEPTPAQLEEFVDEVAPSIQDQIDQVAELTPPEGDEDLVEQFVDQANRDLDAVEEDPSVLAGDTDPFADTSQVAEELGITECAD